MILFHNTQQRFHRRFCTNTAERMRSLVPAFAERQRLQRCDGPRVAVGVQEVAEAGEVLARREPVNRRSARLVVTPAMPRRAPRVETKARTAPSPAPAPREVTRQSAAVAARRRRRVLGAVLGLNLVVLTLAATSVVAWTWDPEAFAYRRWVQGRPYTDAETGEQLYVNTQDPRFRRRFQEAVSRREAALAEAFKGAGVDALSLSTDEDLVRAIVRFAALRRQRRRSGR